MRPIKFKRPLAKSPYRCGCQWPYSTTSAQFLCVTVTFGPPFLERGSTQFRASATHSRVFETDFGSAAYLKAGAEFLWPLATSASGGADLRTMNGAAVSSAFTMHLMDTNREDAFFLPFSAAAKLAVGYIWKRADFPWLGFGKSTIAVQIRPGTDKRWRAAWSSAPAAAFCNRLSFGYT